MSEYQGQLLQLTAQIVTAQVGGNQIDSARVPELIAMVYAALEGVTNPPVPETKELTPAVPIRKSVFPDYIVCLEDGKKLKMLRRHLKTSYNLTPDEYRAKWKLPNDYPMVAPKYAEVRSGLAKTSGLGRKRVEELPPEPERVIAVETEPAVRQIPEGRRGRKVKVTEPVE